MSLLDATSLGKDEKSAARSLDTFVYKQLLEAAGLSKGLTGMAGMVFTDVIAEAIAKGQGEPLTQLGAPTPASAMAAPPLPHAAGQAGVTSGYGTRLDPFTHEASAHRGVDVKADAGSPIPAVWSGTVVQAGERGGYGNAVEIDHGNGVHTLYAHAETVAVRPGDHVEAGQVVAEVGATGRATGPHLHLELRVNGQPIDPQRALKAYAARADKLGVRGGL